MRFKKFSDDWNKYKLSQVCNYSNTKGIRSKKYYVSTENINSNYSGISQYNDDVQVKGTTFKKGDILLSNIRPYLKKAWLANFDGVTNQDVLVLHATNIYSPFLYQIVASQSFVDYVMSSVKGIKMPRGDKDQIMEYQIHIPSPTEQNSIVKFLEMLDSRIETQNKIIKEYETQRNWIINHIFKLISKKEHIKVGNTIIEYNVKTNRDREYEVLSSTMNGIFVQTDYFDKQTSSKSTIGYKIIPKGYATYRSMSDTGEFKFNLQEIIECGIVSPAYPVFYAKTNYLLKYILLCLNEYKSVHKQLSKVKQGGTRLALHLSTLCDFLIPNLSLNEQTKIMKAIDALNEKLQKEKDILNAYKKQKAYLLQNMFI